MEKLNLATIKLLNTKGIAGLISSSFPASNLNYDITINSGFVNNSPHLWSKIGQLKNVLSNRFEYEGLPDGVEIEDIETEMFLWGKTAFFKVGEQYRVANFTPQDNDFYMKPKSIKVIPKNTKIRINKILTIGKNVELIYNDNAFLFGKVFYGSLWQVWPLLNQLEDIQRAIKENLPLIVNFLGVPHSISDEDFTKTKGEVGKISNVKKIDAESSFSNMKAGKGQNGSLFAFPDKTTELLINYNFVWEQIKEMLGISSNAMPDKKERQINKEITINNAISDAIIETQLKNRKIAIEKINKTFPELNITVNIKEEEKQLFDVEGEEKNEDKDTNLSEE